MSELVRRAGANRRKVDRSGHPRRKAARRKTDGIVIPAPLVWALMGYAARAVFKPRDEESGL